MNGMAKARTMLASGPGSTRGRSLPRRAAAALAAACAAVAAILALSGCGARASTTISIASAYIPQPTTPGTTVAYLDIRNNGTTADRLVSASTSVGGHVGFLAPDGMRDGTMLMKVVPDIAIPGNQMVRLNPNSFRLRITGAGPMHGGKDVILKLTFAHAGSVNIVALVTDPESGGGSYFLN
jgi:copper(I)-binding protein